MKKIMFNDKYGLTQAVLEGRKTQTRRIVTCPKTFKGEQVAGFHVYKRPTYGFISEICMYDEDERDFDEGQIVPKYKVGEVVAVSQSYESISESISKNESVEKAKFYCDVMKTCYPNDEIPRDKEEISGWNNKMFVKPELMPHQIRITNVRIERLQDISDEDCLKEGVVISEPKIKGGVRMYYPCEYLKSCAKKIGWGRVYHTPREAYATLIDEVSGKGTWNSNPYVFVYDFELVK